MKADVDPNVIVYFGGQYMPMHEAHIGILTHALHYGTGVFEGIRAYWNAAGTSVAAVKGHTRGCHVSMIGAATKIQDEALAQKLGDICNKLFALP